MWMIPSQLGDSLEQFAKAFANKDDDGVFRYETSSVDQETKDMAGVEDTDRWFDTSTDPELAKALAEARAVANKHVDAPDPTMDRPEIESAVTASRDLEPRTRVQEPVVKPVTEQDS